MLGIWEDVGEKGLGEGERISIVLKHESCVYCRIDEAGSVGINDR